MVEYRQKENPWGLREEKPGDCWSSMGKFCTACIGIKIERGKVHDSSAYRSSVVRKEPTPILPVKTMLQTFNNEVIS